MVAVATLGSLAVTSTAVADPSSQGNTDASQSVQLVQNTDDSDQNTDASENTDGDTQTTDASQGADASQSADASQGTDADTQDADASQNADASQDTDAAQTTDADAQNTDAQTTDDQTDDATTQNADEGISTAAISDHTVPGLTPKGINIDLFDYWLYTQDAADRTEGTWNSSEGKWENSPVNADNSGINDGHALKFNPSTDAPEGPVTGTNKWTETTQPRSGIVSSSLQDGYPVLSGSSVQNSESLAYLFNPDVQSDGKASYRDVEGLLQLDGNGNYTYDSRENYAVYENGKFTLYDQGGVTAAGRSEDGQFFPFNSASQVFDTDSGDLIQKEQATSDYSVMNHLFGLHMNATVVQPEDGNVSTDSPMIFDFSGDDDVWVFIDDKLVGDLGGIHDMSTLSINFASGEVKVNGGTGTCRYETNGSGQQVEVCGETTRLQDLFNLPDDTFAAGTYHTLDMFYLERGNSDSNLRLTTNLVSVPESDIVKVDQSGEELEGAQFALYDSTVANGAVQEPAEDAEPVARGTTDENGNLVLLETLANGQRSVLDFAKRYSDGHRYYVLKETDAPAGYSQTIKSMKLEYVSVGSSGALASFPRDNSDQSSVWDTGGVARAKESIAIAPESTFATTADDSPCKTTACKASETIGKGQMVFAVILKRLGDGDIADENTWKVMSGNSTDGWKLSDSTMANIISATKYPLATTVNANGKYEAEIPDLPGYLEDYYSIVSDKTDTKYTVGLYYSTAMSIEDVEESNTYRIALPTDLISDNFERTFSSRLYVPNIKNELFVQKVDENGDPVDGAQFGLYKDTQVSIDQTTGVVTPIDGQEPSGGRVTTQSGWMTDQDKATPVLRGAAMFAVRSKDQDTPGISGTPLESGTYYLIEESAPADYTATTDTSKIVVQDEGIFACAGDANDDIKVVRGVGQLVSTLSTYGSTGSFNDTLRYVYSTPMKLDLNTDGTFIGTGSQAALFQAHAEDGVIKTTTEATTDSLHLTYGGFSGGVGAALQYGPSNTYQEYMFVGDEGWPIMRTYQDKAYRDSLDENQRELEYTELGNIALSSVITGSVLVQVTNERAGVELAADSINVSKTVKGAAAVEDFDFTLTLDSTKSDVNDVISGLNATTHGTSVTLAMNELDTAEKSATKGFNALKFLVPSGTTAPKNYTFIVKETIPTTVPSGWKYDQSEYTVTVTLTNTDGTWSASVASVQKTKDFNGRDITNPTNVEDKVATFVNQYVAVSSLPLTGGPSSMSYTWLALCIAGIGVLSWLSVNRWRNRHVVQ